MLGVAISRAMRLLRAAGSPFLARPLARLVGVVKIQPPHRHPKNTLVIDHGAFSLQNIVQFALFSHSSNRNIVPLYMLEAYMYLLYRLIVSFLCFVRLYDDGEVGQLWMLRSFCTRCTRKIENRENNVDFNQSKKQSNHRIL